MSINIPNTVSSIKENISILLYRGKLHFKTDNWEFDSVGDIIYHWIPEPHITIVAPRAMDTDILAVHTLSVTTPNASQPMPLRMKSLKNDNINALMGYYLDGEIEQPVDLIRFEIPNLMIFHPEPGSTEINTLILECDDFEFAIQSQNYHHIPYSCLDGGYISNGRAELRVKKGIRQFSDFKETFKLLGKFLSFIHGRRIEPIFFHGYQDGELKFKYYPIQNIDENDLPWTWFHFILSRKDNALIQDMWRRMYGLYKTEDDRGFVDLVMHFYAEATYNKSSMETSITIIQNALELLCSKILVEDNSIVDRADFDKMSAGSLLNVLLIWANIPNEIPEEFSELNSFAKGYNINNGPQVLTLVRNCIVHPHMKNREKFKKLDFYIKNQVLRIGVYYTELIMLKYFEYNGHYDSRFKPANNTVRPPVPWAKR